MFMYSCSSVTVDVIMERNVLSKAMNAYKKLAGNRRTRQHMNTIYWNKSNTNSSTFNMKHISELVDVFPPSVELFGSTVSFSFSSGNETRLS